MKAILWSCPLEYDDLVKILEITTIEKAHKLYRHLEG